MICAATVGFGRPNHMRDRFGKKPEPLLALDQATLCPLPLGDIGTRLRCSPGRMLATGEIQPRGCAHRFTIANSPLKLPLDRNSSSRPESRSRSVSGVTSRTVKRRISSRL